MGLLTRGRVAGGAIVFPHPPVISAPDDEPLYHCTIVPKHQHAPTPGQPTNVADTLESPDTDVSFLALTPVHPDARTPRLCRGRRTLFWRRVGKRTQTVVEPRSFAYLAYPP